MRISILAGCLFFSSLMFASEDHGIGKITNDELDLSYIDHVLAGRVGDRPVFARPLEGRFGLYLWHRANGKNYETTLELKDGKIVGGVATQSIDGQVVEEQFQIVEYSRESGSLSGSIGEKHFSVKVSSETMDGHHYVNPHFLIVIDNLKHYEFDIKDSKACMGCIMKLSYAIISMLYGYGAL